MLVLTCNFIRFYILLELLQFYVLYTRHSLLKKFWDRVLMKKFCRIRFYKFYLHNFQIVILHMNHLQRKTMMKFINQVGIKTGIFHYTNYTEHYITRIFIIFVLFLESSASSSLKTTSFFVQILLWLLRPKFFVFYDAPFFYHTIYSF